ncbi:hypothetical protein ABZP36_014617 [Zizania latifolia]
MLCFLVLDNLSHLPPQSFSFFLEMEPSESFQAGRETETAQAKNKLSLLTQPQSQLVVVVAKDLQVLPDDDAARIHTQYSSIVRYVEPVRDDLPGAEVALQLVNDAYAVLSDSAERARYVSGEAHFESWCDENLPTKGVCADRSTPYDPNPELGRLNSLDAEDNGAISFTDIVPPYTQYTDRSCLNVGNCSNIASSSKTKRSETCFVGDDGGSQLPDEDHVDKKQESQGEVWAIYRNWDIEWYNDPGMHKKSNFSVVEILTSYFKGSDLFVRLEHCLSLNIPPFLETCNMKIHQQMLLLCPLLRSLHNDTNGFHEASVTQFSDPSTSKMDLGNPQKGMMNYNNKLSPENFVEGQIWAVYDAQDRMPRSYVRVIRVVSHTAVFVLKLEPHPMLNEEIRWIEDGLPVSCGVFRVGTETTYKEMSEFSHLVECDWSAKRSFYQIFPKKGEIWAMYKNWKITFNSTDIDKCEPRMVEILSDYCDEIGVNACRLTRGFGEIHDRSSLPTPQEKDKYKGEKLFYSHSDMKVELKKGSSTLPRREASMEHGGEEDDTGSRCRRIMRESDATKNGEATKQQALRLAEDLSLPSVQVVVMSANMGCSHCRQRVTKVVSRMNGLLDYMVDFGKKEVTVRGTVVHTNNKRKQRKKKRMANWENKSSSRSNDSVRTLSWFLRCYGS